MTLRVEHPLRRSRREDGLTIVELLIGAMIAVIVGGGALHFYQASHHLQLAQMDVADRQSNIRFAIDALTRQVRRAGYRVPGNALLRVSATLDTLEIYMGKDTGPSVDTLRYYVDHTLTPPTLMRRLNHSAPAAFAEGIDSAWFVPAGGPPAERLAISLITVEQKHFESSAMTTRRRLAVTVALRNQ
jgi:hypothetical protein